MPKLKRELRELARLKARYEGVSFEDKMAKEL